MTTPNIDGPTRAEMQAHIESLEKQHLVDQELIRHLEADGVIDRDNVANLEFALKSARCIGAALGVLMERYKITDDEAFRLLSAASQRKNMKLRALSEELILTGLIAN